MNVCPCCNKNTIIRIVLDKFRFQFKCQNDYCGLTSNDYFFDSHDELTAYNKFFENNKENSQPNIPEALEQQDKIRKEIEQIFHPFSFNTNFKIPRKENFKKTNALENTPSTKSYEERKSMFLDKFLFPDFIQELIKSDKIIVADIKEIPKEIPEYAKYDQMQKIETRITKLLEKNGIKSLYKYQFEVYDKIKNGEDLIVTAPTSSGKTESFLIPILEHILLNPGDHVQAIFVYPAKALSNNQIEKIFRYAKNLGIVVRKIDGDTEKESESNGDSEREEVLNSNPQIILTNFDFLHAHMWRKDDFSDRFNEIISNLKFLVVDEVHKNYGTVGSNNANVILRMRRKFKKFQTIGLSATLDSVDEFSKTFFGSNQIDVIEGSGKRGKMYMFLLFPGILEGRQTSEQEIISDVFGELLKNNHRSLCFSNSRMGAEEIFIECKENKIDCKIHRAGLLKTERERVEKMLKNGDVDGVVATPTLELGMDIGEIDGVVSEFTSYSTFKQRAGRAGRGSQEISYGFLVLKQKDPISRYYLDNPAAYYKDNMKILIDPDNPTIKSAHLLFSALDKPITDDEIESDDSGLLKKFKENGILNENSTKDGYVPYPDIADSDFASFSLRDIGTNVDIFEDSEKIGEWDLPMAFAGLHPNAIYLHCGIAYRVMDFDSSDVQNLKCNVKESEIQTLRTRASIEKFPSISQIIDERKVLGISAKLCYVDINMLIRSYKQWDKTEKNVKVIDMQDFKIGLQTTGIEFDFTEILPKLIQSPDFAQNKSAAFHTLEHLLIHSSNMLAGGISMDVDGISIPSQNKIIIFDRSANGGNGASKSIFKVLEELFSRANQMVNMCECKKGCPRCIQYFQCGEFNQNLKKDTAKTFCKIIYNSKSSEDMSYENVQTDTRNDLGKQTPTPDHPETGNVVLNANISVGDYFTKKIANAKKYVYIASPWITSRYIPELAKLAEAGVCVKIITSDDKNNGEQVKTLKLLNDHKNQPMFAFKIMGARQVHSKIYLVDGIHLFVPSANMSDIGLNNQHNTVTMSTRPNDIKKFETIFFELWHENNL
jgi:DEAD/DEAH box helicase domain-containing protein